MSCHLTCSHYTVNASCEKLKESLESVFEASISTTFDTLMTLLITTSKQHLQESLDIVDRESEKVGLGLNAKKTVTMVISKKTETPTCKERLKNFILDQVESFKYLGAAIGCDGRNKREIRIRIAQAKNVFAQLSKILTNPRISFKTRKRLLDCHISPIMKYGSEAWTINNKAVNSINAAEMWCLRRMLKISYLDRVTNEEVLRRAGVRKNLCRNIRKTQATFFGHIMRRRGLEHMVTAGRIEGKQAEGDNERR